MTRKMKDNEAEDSKARLMAMIHRKEMAFVDKMGKGKLKKENDMKGKRGIKLLGIGILIGAMVLGSTPQTLASYIDEVTLATKFTKEIAYVSYEIRDDNSGGLRGNSNGVADDGETFALTVNLTARYSEYKDISAELISLNEYAAVAEEGGERAGAVSAYPDITHIKSFTYSEEANRTPFKVAVADNIPNGSSLSFKLSVSGTRIENSLLDDSSEITETFSVGFALPIMRIGLKGGDSQFGRPGTPASSPLEVMLTLGDVENWKLSGDWDTSSCQGRRVIFEVVEGNCTLSAYVATTNADGEASVEVTSLGALSGGQQVAKSVIEVRVDGNDPLSHRRERFTLYAHEFDISFKKVWDMQEALYNDLNYYETTGFLKDDDIRPYHITYEDLNNDGEEEIAIPIYLIKGFLTTVAIIKYVDNDYVLTGNLDTFKFPELYEVGAWAPGLYALDNAGGIFQSQFSGTDNLDDAVRMVRKANLNGFSHYKEIKTANVDADHHEEILALRDVGLNLKGDQLIYVLDENFDVQQALNVGDLSSGAAQEVVPDMVIGDIDNDGMNEIVISRGVSYPNRMIYFKYEDMRFVRRIIEVSGASVFPALRGIVADLDGDGEEEFMGCTYFPVNVDGGYLPVNSLFTAKMSRDGARLESDWRFSLNNMYSSNNQPAASYSHLSGEALRVATLPNLLGDRPVVFADVYRSYGVGEAKNAESPARVYMFSSVDGELVPIHALDIDQASSVSDVVIGDFNKNGLTDIMVRVEGFSSDDYSANNRNVLIYEEEAKIPPEAPSDLAGEVEIDKVTLSWKDNSINEDGFKIYRTEHKEGIVNADVIATVVRDVTTYSDENVAPGYIYIYKVCAFNKDGDSGYSNPLTIDVSSGSIPPPELALGQVLVLSDPEATEPDVFDPAETVTAVEGSIINCRLALSPSNSPLQYEYTVNGLPAGATFDTETLTFDWGSAQIGGYEITFTVREAVSPDSSFTTAPLIIYIKPPFHPCDVNKSGRVTPLDALELIAFLNNYGSGKPAGYGGNGVTDNPKTIFYDVTANNGGIKDGITPLDILYVISEINRLSGLGGSGEGEGPSLQLEDNAVLDVSIKSLKAVNSNITEFYANSEKAFYIDYDNDNLISREDYNAYIAEVFPELNARQEMMLKYKFVLIPSKLLYGENILKMERVRLSDGKTYGDEYFVRDYTANKWVSVKSSSLHCGENVLKVERAGTSTIDYFIKDSNANTWLKLKPYRWTRRWWRWTWSGTTSPEQQFNTLKKYWRWWWYRRYFWNWFNAYLNNVR